MVLDAVSGDAVQAPPNAQMHDMSLLISALLQ
jgi:hypothetical protein